MKRHFERRTRQETVPGLRERGIDVIVPPDEWFAEGRYTDHVHLDRSAAVPFTRWLAGEVAGRLDRE